jgi:phosphatidate cytidylyltransferase
MSDLKLRFLAALGLLLPAGFCLWQGGLYSTLLIGLLFLLLALELGVLAWKLRLWRSANAFLVILGFGYLGAAGLYVHQHLVPLWGEQVFHASATSPLLIYLIALVAFADIGAYFSGRLVGGPLLAPRISPKKTWSGFVGGMIVGTVGGLLLYPDPVWGLLGVGFFSAAGGAGAALAKTALLVLISQAGDLLESSLKRRWQVKDSSQLIPGHGGFWDRFDGFLAVLVFLALYTRAFP